MRAFCQIHGYMRARIRKGRERDVIYMCASCDFQRGDRISTPGLGWALTRRYYPRDKNKQNPNIVRVVKINHLNTVSRKIMEKIDAKRKEIKALQQKQKVRKGLSSETS